MCIYIIYGFFLFFEMNIYNIWLNNIFIFGHIRVGLGLISIFLFLEILIAKNIVFLK